MSAYKCIYTSCDGGRITEGLDGGYHCAKCMRPVTVPMVLAVLAAREADAERREREKWAPSDRLSMTNPQKLLVDLMREHGAAIEKGRAWCAEASRKGLSYVYPMEIDLYWIERLINAAKRVVELEKEHAAALVEAKREELTGAIKYLNCGAYTVAELPGIRKALAELNDLLDEYGSALSGGEGGDDDG